VIQGRRLKIDVRGSAVSFAARLRIASILVLCASACRTQHDHFRVETWRGSARALVRDSSQWGPVAVAAAVTPMVLAFDRSTSIESVEEKFFKSDTASGDVLALSLGCGPILAGLMEAATVDDARHLEVTTEAIVLTALGTQFLKTVVHRQRPDGSRGSESFPSGHTSFAFSGATLIGRWWQDTHAGSLLGYAAYFPAAYVGISRLEGERHFLSDVTFGAALGIATSHLLWNAHFGTDDNEGIFERRVSLDLVPFADEHRTGLSLNV